MDNDLYIAKNGMRRLLATNHRSDGIAFIEHKATMNQINGFFVYMSLLICSLKKKGFEALYLLPKLRC